MSLNLLDLSFYQGAINATSAEEISQKYDGVIIKATQGTDIVDADLANNVTVFRDLESDSFCLGFYHFSNASNPNTEAQHFLDCILPIMPGEFVALDFENEAYANPGVWCWEFALNVINDSRTNHLIPMVYTTRSILTKNPDGNDWTSVFYNCPIWLADPGQDPNGTPTYNGKPVPYTVDILQYGDGVVPGINGLVDQDAAYFNSVDALKKCGFQVPTPVTAPSPVAIIAPVVSVAPMQAPQPVLVPKPIVIPTKPKKHVIKPVKLSFLQRILKWF